jgi:hypothetical protein
MELGQTHTGEFRGTGKDDAHATILGGGVIAYGAGGL